MATSYIDEEYELKKKTAKEFIAAGGCYAISYWSRTDAERLCPEVHKDFEQIEVPVYVQDWLEAAKKAIQLIQSGIDILESNKQTTVPVAEEKKWTDSDMNAIAKQSYEAAEEGKQTFSEEQIKDANPLPKLQKSLAYATEHISPGKRFVEFEETATQAERWLHNELANAFVAGWEAKTEYLKTKQ